MISNFVKKANNLQEKLIPQSLGGGGGGERVGGGLGEEEEEIERGWNWEDNDNVRYCRLCDNKFEFAPLPPIKRLWKHHCRDCGGVICENCLIAPEGRKICLGCFRGETPGEEIQNEVQRRLEADESRRRRPTNTQGKIKSKLGSVKNALSIAKDGTAIPESLALPDVPAARRLNLQRGYLYGENGATLPSGATSFCLSGYFEFANKSEEFCGIKLLPPGTDTLFEAARPSYLAVPPGGAVNILFDANTVEELDLLLLFQNPHPVDPDIPIRFDTQARGADRSKMSPCSAIANFTRILLVRIPCKDKNVLLKYKGEGIVQPRHGGSVTRVGLLGRLQGKRFAEDVLDYSTNVDTIDVRILI